MQSKQFRSLNHKLLNYVSWSALTLLFVAALLSFFIQYERSKVNTLAMLNQLLDTVEDTATVAAYSKNLQIAEDVVKGLMKNDIVHRVTISSTDGFNLEQSKNNKLNTENIVSRPIYSLFDTEEIIGQIQIQPNALYSLTEAKYDTITNIISSFILIGVTALVILWVMQKYISRPLTLVSDTLNKIRLGERQRISPLTNNANDELGQLRTDINTLLGVLEDEFKKEHELRESIEAMEKKLRHIYNSSSAGLFLLDRKGRLLTSNSTLLTILNLSSVKNLTEQQLVFASLFKEQDKVETLLNKAIESEQLEAEDFLLEYNGGVSVWVHCLMSKITDSSGRTNLEGVLFDVTNRVKAERAIQHEAEHDPLTGLLRRQAAQAIFENACATNNCAFLMMDLDGFKQANDTYGHIAGDKVLQISAERLSQCVRTSDVVCRLGGDEFLIVLFAFQEQGQLSKIAEKIVLAIEEPVIIDDNTTIKVGISVGIFAYSANDKNTFESMIQGADEAMYEVKRQGKNGYCIKDENNEMIPRLAKNGFQIKD